jgi:uncharacterized protein YndB with AHSA1/START domain
MTESTDAATRSAETGLEIKAPVDAVWSALTEAPEIVRWFALEADVTPGAGGSVVWRWADAYRWQTRIEIWEPARRLALTYNQTKNSDHRDLGGPAETAGHEMVVDFQIASHAGGTWLRCVHSGFGRDASWDDELEGVRRGWLAELESLRHYLEHHRGKERRSWWAFVRPSLPAIEAWRALAPRASTGEGLIATDTLGSIQLAVPGLEADLMPVRLDPPGDLVARIPAWNDAMLRIWCDPQPGNGSMISLFLSHYGNRIPQEEEAARARLLGALTSALGVRVEDATVLEA